MICKKPGLQSMTFTLPLTPSPDLRPISDGARRWNQHGPQTRLPPVHACRSDGLPFTPDDWACLCEFQEYLDETQLAQEHLWYTNRAEFRKWVALWTGNACLKRDRPNPHAFSDICAAFDVRFPLGVSVRACGLAAKPELNGRVGTVRLQPSP